MIFIEERCNPIIGMSMARKNKEFMQLRHKEGNHMLIHKPEDRNIVITLLRIE